VRVALALGLSLLVVFAGAAWALSVERPRLAGTNNVFDNFANVELAPGQEACAQAELVPGDTGAVRVHAQASEPPGGPVAARLVRDGREIARGGRPGGWTDGEIDVPVRPAVESTTPDVDVCLANRGGATIALWGHGAPEGTLQRTVREGEPLDERIRLSYVRPGPESGWELIGALDSRMSVGRGSWMEGWALYGWLAALAGLLAAVTIGVLRELRA
jgi:hypothetical protein